MNVNRNGNKVAPHKAILLLAIIDLIERGILTDPFIPLSDELIQTFKSIWKMRVTTTKTFSHKIYYPFFHLQSSPFWNLIKSSTYIGQKEYTSLGPLKRDYIGAQIDDDLFQFLTNHDSRNEIKQLIIGNFLTDSSNPPSNKLCLLALIGICCTIA